MLARRSGSDWSIEIVDDRENSGWYPSFAFDPWGRPAISYNSPIANLTFVRWNGSTWDRDVVDHLGRVGAFSSLAFDADGLPAISYHADCSGSLRLARYQPDCDEPGGSCPPGWGCACGTAQSGDPASCECVRLPVASAPSLDTIDALGSRLGF
jgi:hypothetical protein